MWKPEDNEMACLKYRKEKPANLKFYSPWKYFFHNEKFYSQWKYPFIHNEKNEGDVQMFSEKKPRVYLAI